MKAIVHDNQSLFDIAIQHCGAADAAYDIAVMNGLSITDSLTAGQTIEVPQAVNKDIIRYFKDKGISPATASVDKDQVVTVKYGRMYNWHAVMDIRGLVPEGWSVPAESDWLSLINYLGGNSVAGGKLKEVGFEHWNSPNTGASNISGFKALAGGYCAFDFAGLGEHANFWSRTTNIPTTAASLQLNYNSQNALLDNNAIAYGFSIRGIKNTSDWEPGETVEDVCGNLYATIKIGNQVWMASNLITTKYKNGDDIPEVTDNFTWYYLTTGAWRIYDNDPSNL